MSKKWIQSFGNDLWTILRIPMMKRPLKSKSGFVIFVWISWHAGYSRLPVVRMYHPELVRDLMFWRFLKKKNQFYFHLKFHTCLLSRKTKDLLFDEKMRSTEPNDVKNVLNLMNTRRMCGKSLNCDKSSSSAGDGAPMYLSTSTLMARFVSFSCVVCALVKL